MPWQKMSASACGAFGEQCKQCAGKGASCQPKSGACITPVTQCGPDNCAGCCESDTLCADGVEWYACGSRGAKCEFCYARLCVPNADGGGGTCTASPACGPENCAGCCFQGKCTSGHDVAKCGTNGELCQACPDGVPCVSPGLTGGATCQELPFCTPQTCKTCCSGKVCMPGDTDTACGSGAITACRDCTALGKTCVSGTCQ